jgi:uncharacterized RDD family membrane protein YckC
MENIAIQTSQNISIEQPLASVGERIVATGIDYLFIGAYTIFISMIVTISKSLSAFLLLMLPVLFYQLFSETIMNGQSWGKKIMKIKVCKIDGTEAGFSAYFIRWAFRIVDITLFFGAIATLVIIINGKGQRIGDLVASTTVIRLKKRAIGDTIFTILPDNYSLVFPQVNKLTDADIYTAKEVIEFLDNSKNHESIQMGVKAQRAIEEKMGIKTDMQSRKFLLTIINDYNYYYSR